MPLLIFFFFNRRSRESVFPLINFVLFYFSAFQEHSERMRKKLSNQRQQEVDDEDDRIAKAVAERESKREVLRCIS